MTIALYIMIVGGFLGYCVFAWKKPGWALVLMTFAIGAIVTTAVAVNDPFIAVVGAFLFPVTIGLVRWTPTSSPLEMPWHKAFAKTVITVFQYLILLVILCYVLNVFGGILFLLLIIGIVRFAQVRKHSLTLDILSAIGMSMRQSLPLPMALITAAHGQKPKEARAFQEIAHWLTQGYPLSQALHFGYPKCPPELLVSIAIAEKMNQLPQTIEALLKDLSERINGLKQSRPAEPWYPLVILFITFNVVLALMYFIVPIYSEVLSDVTEDQSGLPASTQILLNMTLWLKGRHGFNVLLIVFPLFFVGLVMIFVRFRRRNPQHPRLLSRMGDWIKWHLPLWGWFEKDLSKLRLTETLKVGLSAGYPLNLTIRNAIDLDLNYCYRKRLIKWLEMVEQGNSITQSAARAGIGKMIIWGLDETVNKDNAPLILQSLEEVYRSQYNHRSKMVNAALCPLTIVGLSLSIGFVVYALFLPMVRIIQVLL